MGFCRRNIHRKDQRNVSVILPSTFKNIGGIAWVILTDNNYETFTTNNMIIDKRISKENSFVLFAQEAFVNINSKNHTKIFYQILLKKYVWDTI